MKIGYLMQEGVPDIRKKPLSGAANHVVCVIHELKKAGHTVSLLAKIDGHLYLSHDLENFEPVKDNFLDKGLIKLIERVIRRFQFELKLPYANFFESLRFALACQMMLRDCDIYFERMGWLGYGGGLAARWLNIPLVLEVNGDHVDEFKSRGLVFSKNQERLSYYLMKQATVRASYIVATGAGWRQKFISRWGTDPSKISVIQNGSMVVERLPQEDLAAFRNAWSEADIVNIVYLGGFEPWHGISILLKAVSMAVKSYSRLHLYLIGDGPDREVIVQMMNSLELNDVVTLLGSLSMQEVISYLKMSDIGVSPYCGRVEYSGLKLLDYKGAGLAIISSGVDGQPDILRHGQTGWIVTPCNEDALCQAIVDLSTNVSLRKSLGRQARLEAEKYHRWSHTAQKLELVFNQLLALQE
jgi:glycosyltransferase involved in cell wall biosynthesis